MFSSGGYYYYIVSTVGGLLHIEHEIGTDVLSVINSGTDAYDTTHGLVYQDAAFINNDQIIATEAGNGQPIKVFANDSSLLKTIALDNADRYMWSAAASSDQTKIAISGGKLALLSYDSSQADIDKVQLEYQETVSGNMRHMEFVDFQNSSYLLGVMTSGSIRVYNVDNLASPVFIKEHVISAFDGEAYDLKILADQELVFVAGTGGKFAILSLPGLVD